MTAAPGPSPIGGGPAPGGARCRTPGPPEAGPDEFLGGVGDFFEGAADAVGDAALWAADKGTDALQIGAGAAGTLLGGTGVGSVMDDLANTIDYEGGADDAGSRDRQTAQNPTGQYITDPITQGVNEAVDRFRQTAQQRERQTARNPGDVQQGGLLSNPLVIAALVGVGGFLVVQATS